VARQWAAYQQTKTNPVLGTPLETLPFSTRRRCWSSRRWASRLRRTSAILATGDGQKMMGFQQLKRRVTDFLAAALAGNSPLTDMRAQVEARDAELATQGSGGRDAGGRSRGAQDQAEVHPQGAVRGYRVNGLHPAGRDRESGRLSGGIHVRGRHRYDQPRDRGRGPAAGQHDHLYGDQHPGSPSPSLRCSGKAVWLFNGVSGTSVSTALPAWDTVAEIVSDAAIELGLISAAISDPFASTDPNILQLIGLLKSGGASWRARASGRTCRRSTRSAPSRAPAPTRCRATSRT
jgi:hypothetical protein